MSKQLAQFAGVLFMLAALLAVSAQENTTALNNATMNNTTLLNNTTLNASVIEVPILPAETANETALNETVSVEEIIPVQNATASPVVSQPEVMQVGSPKRAVSAIGGGESAQSVIPIGGNALPTGAYEVGLPAKTIMDLSALPFLVNKI
jgi:hypothetical protein